MNRRGFLGLLIAAPVAAAAAKLAPLLEPALSPALEEVALSRVQRYWLPFMADRLGNVKTIVQPGRIVQLVSRVQRPFRPTRLVLPVSAAGFELFDITAGGEVMLASAVPAAFFDSRLGTSLRFGVAAPGDEIVIAARNMSRVP